MQNNQNNQNEPIIRFNQSDSDSDDRKLDDENQGNFQLNRIVESQNLNANNVIKNENDLEKFKNKFSPEFKNDIMNKLPYQSQIPNYIQEENILSESIEQNNKINQDGPIIRCNQNDSDSDDRKLDDEIQGNFQMNRIVENQSHNVDNIAKNENDLEK